MNSKPSVIKNGKATVSLIVGIIGFSFVMIGLWNGTSGIMILGAILNVIALLLGFMAMPLIKYQNANGRGAALVGIILSAIALFAIPFYLFLLLPAFASM